MRSFVDNDVEFLVVGGYAVIAHGYVRTTGDIDLWIAADPGSASGVIRALEAAGYHPPIDAIQVLQTEPAVLRLGQPPFRIDVVTHIDGCDWNDAWRRRVVIEIDGIAVPFLGLDDLKASKRATGRSKDLADLENLPTPET